MTTTPQRRIAFGLSLVLLSPIVSAQVRVAIPPDAVMWWIWDPTPISSAAHDAAAIPEQLESRLARGLMRAASASGIIAQPAAADVVRATLAASEVFALPHTVVVRRLEEAPLGEAGTIRIEAVIDLTAPSKDIQKRLMRTLEAVLVTHCGEGDGGAQRVLDLGPLAEGVAFRRADWPPDMEVAWCSSTGHFTVALGRGVLARWLAEQGGLQGGPRADIQAQVQRIERLRRGTTPLFQFGLDCTRLRAGLPAEANTTPTKATDGRVARMLREWSLANARSFMLHASVIPPSAVRTRLAIGDVFKEGEDDEPYTGAPLVVLDATWSARSEPLETIGHAALTEAFWPAAELGLAPARSFVGDPAKPASDAKSPRASFAMVFRSELLGSATSQASQGRDAIDVLAKFYSGLLGKSEGESFGRSLEKWKREARATKVREARRLGQYIVVLGPSSPTSFAMSGLSIVAPLNAQADADVFQRDLELLLSPMKSAKRKSDDAPTRSLQTAEYGVIDLAAWRVVGKKGKRGALLGAIGVGVTEAAVRERIEELERWVE